MAQVHADWCSKWTGACVRASARRAVGTEQGGGLPCRPGNCPMLVAEKSHLHRCLFLRQLSWFQEHVTGSSRSG